MKTILLMLAAIVVPSSEAFAQAAPAQPSPSANVVRGRPASAPASRSARAGTSWRYVFHQGRWWYWSPAERWSYYDGGRWVQLDSLNQPLTQRTDLAERGLPEFRPLPRELPSPRFGPGGFYVGGSGPFSGRSFMRSFGPGAVSPGAGVSLPRDSGSMAPNRYGSDSAYGAYGSTDPFRGGTHSGAGGNYGYGFGTQRPAPVGGAGRTSPGGRPQ